MIIHDNTRESNYNQSTQVDVTVLERKGNFYGSCFGFHTCPQLLPHEFFTIHFVLLNFVLYFHLHKKGFKVITGRWNMCNNYNFCSFCFK